MHQSIHGIMLKVAIMLLSPPKYFFSIEIEYSAIVLCNKMSSIRPLVSISSGQQNLMKTYCNDASVSFDHSSDQ